jgi:5-methylcytosine-specific restriction endonuclease McrA
LDIIQIGWVGLSVHTYKFTQPFSKHSLTGYFNAFGLLGNVSESEGKKVVGESQTLYDVDKDVELPHLGEHIMRLNTNFQNATPHKRITISEQIARPNAITDYLKRNQNYTCQICGELGFFQSNGKRYIEAHHIIELHKSIPGSYCSDNVVIVCANCHKKLHYARIEYVSIDERKIVLRINNVQYQFFRNIISFPQ